jgi:pimeloyl-ACP methyl ester carboxylesterase
LSRVLPNGGTARLSVDEGEIGRGSVYRIYVPDVWNGDLVLYAHGFKDLDEPIVPPTADDWPALRDALLELGYATAYSSFSENGLAVKDGAQRTHQLRGIFCSKHGTPGRTYLAGHSLGGAIAIALAEKHPQHYAGVLPMCGMIGGSRAAIDYVGNVRVLFDFFYGSDVLPGSVLDIPDGVDLINDVVLPVIEAIQDDPNPALAISQIDQTPVPFRDGVELVDAFVRAIAYNYRGFSDIMGRTHGHTPFDNWDTVYSGALPQPVLDAANAGVERYQRAPDATAYLSHYFEPTGDLMIPALTLHTRWDPIVPIFHEDLYREAATAAGKSDLLVQRTVFEYGHCTFGPDGDDPVEIAARVAVMVQAFQDLVNWVENDIKPAP